MSRRYLTSLLVVTLVAVVAALSPMYFAPARFNVALPLLALYFAVVCAVQHWVVTRAMHRSPRAFIQMFFGTLAGTFALHLVVLAAYNFIRIHLARSLGDNAHLVAGRTFTLAFAVGFILFFVFETVALLRFVQHEKERGERQ